MCRPFWVSHSEISSSLLGVDCPGTGTSPMSAQLHWWLLYPEYWPGLIPG